MKFNKIVRFLENRIIGVTLITPQSGKSVEKL